MDTLTKAAEILRPARQFLVLLGGGVSARSGIPTFRHRLTGLLGRQDPQRLETACNDHI
jgi:NAD-dependent SIR2 family protein deacetylase